MEACPSPTSRPCTSCAWSCERISPLIWRRLLVPGDTSFAGLHDILQIGFGWDDEHLHRFVVHGVAYAGGDLAAVRVIWGCGRPTASSTTTTSVSCGAMTSASSSS